MSGTHVPDALLERFALGDVEESVAVAIAQHLDACGRCSTRAASLEPLAIAFASVDDPPVPPMLAEEVLAALREAPLSRPEPAIAAGLMALAFLALVASGDPASAVVGVARVLRALAVASQVLLEQIAHFAPHTTLLAALLMMASAWLARSIELQRRSA